MKRLFSSLSLKLAVLVLAGFAAGVVALIERSNHELATAYAQAGKREVLAVGRNFGTDFEAGDLNRLDELQRRLDSLKRLNPGVEKASIYVRDDLGPRRLASTERGRVIASAGAHDLAPLTTHRPGYHETREAGGHIAELNFPLRDGRSGAVVASLGVYYDLGPLDASLAARKRQLALAASLITLAVLLVGVVALRRMVLGPVSQLRAAARSISEGMLGTRLGWSRSDELGALARDFDGMAADLESSHGRLATMALTDPLTGTLNHRAFQDRLDQEIDRARREEAPLALVAIDVDRFKDVNDTFGHAVGDEVLRWLSSELAVPLRSIDVLGRLGGDELMLILPACTPEDGLAVAERLVERVTARVASPSGPIAVSAGVAGFPADSVERQGLMRCADAAMYRAKRSGGNRAEPFSGLTGDSATAVTFGRRAG